MTSLRNLEGPFDLTGNDDSEFIVIEQTNTMLDDPRLRKHNDEKEYKMSQQ